MSGENRATVTVGMWLMLVAGAVVGTILGSLVSIAASLRVIAQAVGK